jgi:uncharacterized membrane protein YqjE
VDGLDHADYGNYLLDIRYHQVYIRSIQDETTGEETIVDENKTKNFADAATQYMRAMGRFEYGLGVLMSGVAVFLWGLGNDETLVRDELMRHSITLFVLGCIFCAWGSYSKRKSETQMKAALAELDKNE